jgi:uncharacterized membrane protein YhaH (DUF805 family)
MTFSESIKVCFSKYADFNGRASKTEYWWFFLFLILASLIVSYISPTLSAIFSLATLLPSVAAACRRLHDSDRSGWLQLLLLIPILGWIALVYFLIQDPQEPNRFA